MKIQIKNRFDLNIIFETDADSLKIAVEIAVKSGADLYGANLYGANLSGANLSGADLYGADLSGANLSGANLSGANLYGANLYGANLYGADLSGADLSGANLYGANLSGANLSGANLSGANLSGAKIKKILQIGPIGSRQAYLVCYLTENGIVINAGCFWGNEKEFLVKCKEKHGNNIWGLEYRNAIKFIKVYFSLKEK